MRCLYCEAAVPVYPENGICPNCGGALPKSAQTQQFQSPLRICSGCGAQSRSTFCPDCGRNLTAGAGSPPPAAPYERPIPGRTCCPRCFNREITFKKRGFSWWWALAGLFLLPPFGIAFGFIGFKKLRYRCSACTYKWTIG